VKSTKLLGWLILIALLLLGIVLNRCSRRGMNVTPEAREQIEKAKRR